MLAPESTFTDAGLTPDTQYSYAVFAIDGAQASAPATLTLRTRAPGTQAVLKVNPITTNGVKVTIGTPVAFDASDSLPADGTNFDGVEHRLRRRDTGGHLHRTLRPGGHLSTPSTPSPATGTGRSRSA